MPRSTPSSPCEAREPAPGRVRAARGAPGAAGGRGRGGSGWRWRCPMAAGGSAGSCCRLVVILLAKTTRSWWRSNRCPSTRRCSSVSPQLYLGTVPFASAGGCVCTQIWAGLGAQPAAAAQKQQRFRLQVIPKPAGHGPVPQYPQSQARDGPWPIAAALRGPSSAGRGGTRRQATRQSADVSRAPRCLRFTGTPCPR